MTLANGPAYLFLSCSTNNAAFTTSSVGTLQIFMRGNGFSSSRGRRAYHAESATRSPWENSLPDLRPQNLCIAPPHSNPPNWVPLWEGPCRDHRSGRRDPSNCGGQARTVCQRGPKPVEASEAFNPPPLPVAPCVYNRCVWFEKVM